jgi:hypothetical protein
LTKIVYLLHTGESFPTAEATELFFGITKLFQHRDASLRQMVYLAIKELADTAEDVIMVTSSVMKDVAGAGGRGSGDQDIYRANAIRALCRIIDVSQRYRPPPMLGCDVVRKHNIEIFSRPLDPASIQLPAPELRASWRKGGSTLRWFADSCRAPPYKP